MTTIKQMRNILLIPTILLGFATCTMLQKSDPKEILAKSANVLKNRKSFVYEASYGLKFFDHTDTTIGKPFRCEVLKVPEDTVLGYYARMKDQEVEKIYNCENYFSIWHRDKTVDIGLPDVVGKHFIRNNITSRYFPNCIISEKPFEYYLKEGTNWSISEAKSGNSCAWQIAFTLPTNEEVTFYKCIYLIEKQTLLPIRIETFARFMDIEDEYFCLTLSNYSTSDTLQKSSFKSNTYPNNYTASTIENPSTSQKKTFLPDGYPFLKFESADIEGNKIFIDSTFFRDKLVLLDFWYLGCTACVRAMPLLNELFISYHNEGFMVYGLNPYDDLKQKKTTIQQFRSKFKLDYPFLFIDKTISEMYQVSSFPTFYLIKDGIIVHSNKGFNEEIGNELEKIIRENLSK